MGKNAESLNYNRNLARADLLKQSIPHLDTQQLVDYLDAIPPQHLAKLQVGAFGSMAFDIIFSPGIIPKQSEQQFRQTYQQFFQQLYGLEVFDRQGWFTYPEEEKFYPDPQMGPNHPHFLREWVANLRSVALMLRDIRHDSRVFGTITNNLIESALCRMAENGESWPDSLLYALPYGMQERLDTIRQQVKQGRVLAPGQFFRIANEVEFNEQKFMRNSTQGRVTLVMGTIDETSQVGRFSQLPPDPATFQFHPGMNWKNPTPRQARQSNLAPIMPSLEHAEKWTGILLGVPIHSSYPPPLE